LKTIEKNIKMWYNIKDENINLIKSGGVTGTVKPGNLQMSKVLNPER
jgi:hypothetical protein